jgi:hypothetical protein
MKLPKALLVAALIILSVRANAQSIWTNPITGTDPNTANPYTTGQTVSTNITVSGIGRGPNINGNAANNRYNARDWSLAAMDANDYFYFTLTPSAGYEIDFSSFVYTAQASGTGPTTVVIRSSVDNYTANIGSPGLNSGTISLTAAAYQNVSSAITFRVYAWGGSSAAGTYSINDFTFNGTINAAAPTITTGTVSGGPFFLPSCVTAGSVAYTSTGTFTSGNVFTAQLSNASGTFSPGTSIGTLSTTSGSGTINFTIPPGTPAGTGYRIRVVSSAPAATGSTSAAFTVNNGSSGTAGLWVGGTSTDWNNCRNWSNYTVPTTGTSVTINQAASANCVISGTTAAVCTNLTLSSNNGTNRTLTVQNTASLSCSGTVSINKTAGSGNLVLSLLNNAVFSCNNLTLTGSASGSENAQFENETSAPTATVNGNVTINNGGVLDLTDSPNYGVLHIKGDYTNNGLETDFKQSNSIVYFDGTGSQNIGTSGFNEVFGNIVVNKSAGTLTLQDPVEVENNVTFTSGKINTTPSTLLIFLNGATASGMSNNSFTDGPVRKTGDDGFTFPIGAGNLYREATMSAPANTTDHFTAQYFPSDPGGIYDENSRDITLDHLSNCEYWIIDRTNGASDVNITLSWSTNSCGVTNLNDMRVARWDGTAWKDHGNGGTSGTTSAGTVTTSGVVTSFSPFTLGSGTIENPLPVELISFTGECTGELKDLRWITASEQNNAYFTLERSEDAVNYTTVATVPGSGNSNTPREYSYTDAEKSSNAFYYRLSQTDYNGDNEVFQPIRVSCTTANGNDDFLLNIYAVQSGHVTFLLEAPEASEGSLFITDMQGKTMYVQNRSFTAGKQVIEMPVADWAPGIYLLHLTAKEHSQTLKFLLR